MSNAEVPEDPSWVPDYTPTKAYTKATVRQLQDVDPETWRNTANPDFLALGNWIFDQLTNTFLGGARTVFDAIVKWINHFIAALLDALNGLTFGVFNLGPLADRFRGTEQKAVEAHETAMTAVEDARLAAEAAEKNEEKNIANADEIELAKLQIGTKADPESVPTDVPGWVTLNPVEDATFPRADLVPIPTISNGGKTSSVYADGWHDHTVGIVWSDPIYTTVLGRLDIGYINATRARIYNTLGVVIAAGPITGLANFRLHVYKMGRDEDTQRPTGVLTWLWSSPPAGLQGTFSTSAQDIRVELPMDIKAAKGDWFAVVVHQTGSGVTRGLLGKQTAAIAAMPGVHPTRLGMNRSGESTVPATLTPSQLDTSSTWVPWVCMGQTLGIIKVTFTDLFDRADAATLGSNWAVYGVGMDIRSNVARCKRINYGNLKDRKEDHTQAVYVSQLSTNSQSVTVRIGSFDRSQSNLEDNPRVQAAVRSNANMTRCVTVGIRWGIVEIRAYTDANPSGKTMNSTNRTWGPNDKVELRVTDVYAGGVFQHSHFVVYVNNGAVVDWPDLANETSRGPGFRRAGFETGNIHRGAIFGYIHIPSPDVIDWEAKDLTA